MPGVTNENHDKVQHAVDSVITAVDLLQGYPWSQEELAMAFEEITKTYGASVLLAAVIQLRAENKTLKGKTS